MCILVERGGHFCLGHACAFFRVPEQVQHVDIITCFKEGVHRDIDPYCVLYCFGLSNWYKKVTEGIGKRAKNVQGMRPEVLQ